MRLIKSLVLCSTGAAAISAQAADLPTKAKPVEYVKVCSLYGAGFYYIPGTDTCIRIGGHLRSEVSFGNARGTGIQSWTIGDGNATNTRDRDYFFTRQRVFVHTDTRTQTGFGTLRTFSVVRAEINTPTGVPSAPAAAGILGLDAGFIQWGGFTIGRAVNSYFDTPWAYAYKWTPNGSLGMSDTYGGRFVAAYTHQFGNGVSATFAVEDSKERKRGNYNGANALSQWGVNPPAVDTRGGNTMPEIVGQLRIDGAWGGFHLAGSLLNNRVAYGCAGAAGCTEISGPTPSDKLGGAVSSGFRFNVPTGVNDSLYVMGSYSVGATGNIFGNIGQGSSFGLFGGSNSAYGSIAGGYLFDSVYSTTTRAGAGLIVGPAGQQLTTAYGGTIAFEHGWNPEWRTSLFGGVQVVDYNATANAILCSRFGVGSASGTLSNALTSCNMDYRIAGVGSRTYWTPVRDLTVGLEVMWTNHNSSNKGATYATPAVAGFKPIASYEVKDQNVFGGMFSVRRFF